MSVSGAATDGTTVRGGHDGLFAGIHVAIFGISSSERGRRAPRREPRRTAGDREQTTRARVKARRRLHEKLFNLRPHGARRRRAMSRNSPPSRHRRRVMPRPRERATKRVSPMRAPPSLPDHRMRARMHPPLPGNRSRQHRPRAVRFRLPSVSASRRRSGRLRPAPSRMTSPARTNWPPASLRSPSASSPTPFSSCRFVARRAACTEHTSRAPSVNPTIPTHT